MTKSNDNVDEVISNLIKLRKKTKKSKNTSFNYENNNSEKVNSKNTGLENSNPKITGSNTIRSKSEIKSISDKRNNKKFKFINKSILKDSSFKHSSFNVKISQEIEKKHKTPVNKDNITKHKMKETPSKKILPYKKITRPKNIDDISINTKTIDLVNVGEDDAKTKNLIKEKSKTEPVIEINHVSRDFKLSTEKIDNIKEYALKKIKGEIKENTFYALNDVTLTINRGERWGVIGLNGAGKSTLLKIIAGVMKPSSGTVKVSGKIAPLLELGAGFDYNFTGAENIFLNGSILGYSKEFLDEKFDEIVDFSELKEFINVPIKNYSSGMISKLGFSIATLVEPDILILDEVLSVGDVNFRKKSGEKINEMFDSGVTVILVSHGIDQIKELCDKAIWLERGSVVMIGDAKEVCDKYLEKSEK